MDNKLTFTEDWFTRHITIWTTLLTPLEGNIIQALEIGSFEGRATLWLLENVLKHPDSRITCVDTFNGGTDIGKDKTKINWEEVEKNFLSNISHYKDKVKLVKEDSVSYLKSRTEKADIIYIDGSHAQASCLVDAVQSHLLLNHGGIIIFDDYLWQGGRRDPSTPKGAIDFFWESFWDKYEILAVGYQLILRKK